MTGMINLSYAKRDEELEPNPCNRRLGNEATRIIKKRGPMYIVSQWEVARQLEFNGISSDLVIGPHDGRNPRYLDTDDVINKAQALFDELGETEVIVVANPFLHLGMVQKKLRDRGFTVIDEPIRKIGSDTNFRLNKQWWTTNPLLTIVYGVIVKLTGKRGLWERA